MHNIHHTDQIEYGGTVKLNKQTVKSLSYIGISSGIMAGYCLHYAHVLRTERNKRKKIDEFERAYFGAAENGQKRLTKLVEAVPFDREAFWKAWEEETKFMRILRNQPMY